MLTNHLILRVRMNRETVPSTPVVSVPWSAFRFTEAKAAEAVKAIRRAFPR